MDPLQRSPHCWENWTQQRVLQTLKWTSYWSNSQEGPVQTSTHGSGEPSPTAASMHMN